MEQGSRNTQLSALSMTSRRQPVVNSFSPAYCRSWRDDFVGQILIGSDPRSFFG